MLSTEFRAGGRPFVVGVDLVGFADGEIDYRVETLAPVAGDMIRTECGYEAQPTGPPPVRGGPLN